MTRIRRGLTAIPVAAALGFGALAAHGSEKSIIDVARSAGDFTIFLQAVDAAGMTEKLTSGGEYTVFAPTDQAFDAVPPERLTAWLDPANKDELASILGYHIVPETLTAREIGGKKLYPTTVNGEPLTVNSAARVTKVDEAALVWPDLRASNGVIHVIDRVLTPGSG